MSEPVSVLLRRAAAGLAAAGGIDPAEARGEAELLLAHVLRRPRSWLFAHADAPVETGLAARFDALLERRKRGEPVAHLTGRRGFWAFELRVDASTLIPRPETERLVELALERLPAGRPLRLLDLGTGTGAIALALAHERPLARVWAVERSPEALALARQNAVALGLAERVELRVGDWFAPVAGERFDLIASNPPYIEAEDPHLEAGDLRFEPRTALAAGPDGLADLRRIVAAAPRHLVPGGWLLLEHGWRQGAALRTLLAAAGFTDIATAPDLEGRERVSLGRLPA